MSKKTKTTPEKLLPVITGGIDCKIQLLDARITGTEIIMRGSYRGDNPKINVLEIRFTRLFRVDDQFADVNGFEEVVLSDDDFFYFTYEFEIKPSKDSLYSQLLKAAFYGKEMPVYDYSPSMLHSNWVRLVIEDGRYLIEVLPLTDTTAISKE